jgi:hypothetical protein
VLDIEVDAELLLKLTDAVSSLASEVAQTKAAVVRSTARPNSYKVAGSAVADTAGNALILLDACPQGQRWVLRHLVVGGITWLTAAAGNAQVLVTSGQPQSTPDAPVSIQNTEDATNNPGAGAGSGLPSIAFYDQGDMITLDAGDWLSVYVTGGTSTQQYSAWARLDRHFLSENRTR